MKQPRSIPSLNENGEREREAVRDVYMEKRERDVYVHTQQQRQQAISTCDAEHDAEMEVELLVFQDALSPVMISVL